jgi:hypothetical protein
MEMTYRQICSDLAMLLRDHPVGTTADLTDWTLVYWDGRRIAGIYLSEDRPSKLDEVFDFDEYVTGQMEEYIVDWFAAPRFTLRHELVGRLKDPRPFDADV